MHRVRATASWPRIERVWIAAERDSNAVYKSNICTPWRIGLIRGRRIAAPDAEAIPLDKDVTDKNNVKNKNKRYHTYPDDVVATEQLLHSVVANQSRH